MKEVEREMERGDGRGRKEVRGWGGRGKSAEGVCRQNASAIYKRNLGVSLCCLVKTIGSTLQREINLKRQIQI